MAIEQTSAGQTGGNVAGPSENARARIEEIYQALVRIEGMLGGSGTATEGRGDATVTAGPGGALAGIGAALREIKSLQAETARTLAAVRKELAVISAGRFDGFIDGLGPGNLR